MKVRAQRGGECAVECAVRQEARAKRVIIAELIDTLVAMVTPE